MLAGRKKGVPASPRPSSDGERAFAVVVEQLRGEFKVFGEALGGFREQFGGELGGLREELGGLREQFRSDLGGLREQFRSELGGLREQFHGELGGLREEFRSELGGLREEFRSELGGLREEFRGELGGLRQQITDGFAAVDGRFERVERDLGEVKVDLALVKSAVTTHTRELREIRGALGNKVERGEVEAIVEHAVARIAQR